MATWHFTCSYQISMNDQKTWREMVPMGKKGWIVVGVIAFALVGFLAWKAYWTPNDNDSLALRDQEEKIRDMEDRVARLQKELDESSKKIASLQGGSDEPARGRRSADRSIDNSRRREIRPTDQNASAQPRLYETVRNTAVFEEPSASSRKLSTIPSGIRVRVVGSTGDWLEVRSKEGRPPGFIRSDDAVLRR